MHSGAQALELADEGAAEGQQDADRRWRQSFVSALNAAAMRGIADHNAAAAAGEGAGSQQGDKHRWVACCRLLSSWETLAVVARVVCMQLVQRGHA
jgi:hypothetical protein